MLAAADKSRGVCCVCSVGGGSSNSSTHLTRRASVRFVPEVASAASAVAENDRSRSPSRKKPMMLCSALCCCEVSSLLSSKVPPTVPEVLGCFLSEPEPDRNRRTSRRGVEERGCYYSDHYYCTHRTPSDRRSQVRRDQQQQRTLATPVFLPRPSCGLRARLGGRESQHT